MNNEVPPYEYTVHYRWNGESTERRGAWNHRDLLATTHWQAGEHLYAVGVEGTVCGIHDGHVYPVREFGQPYDPARLCAGCGRAAKRLSETDAWTWYPDD